MDDEDFKPDLGLFYLEAGRGEATFTFTRLAFSMIARVGAAQYTAISTLTMSETYALSIDFGTAAFGQLLALLPVAGQKELKQAVAGRFSAPQCVNIPRDAIVAGVRAKLGEPQSNDDETYVPFVALNFLPARLVSRINIDD